MRIRDVELGEVCQCDGVTCGPTVAMVCCALLDPGYAAALDLSPAGSAAEQRRIHRASNRIWPRQLGTTPWGVAAAVSRHSGALGVWYGWRPCGARERLPDVAAAVDGGWPVGLLIGRVVPRHWVLVVEQPRAGVLCLYDPARGDLSEVTVDDVLHHRLTLGFPRAFAVVLPREAA